MLRSYKNSILNGIFITLTLIILMFISDIAVCYATHLYISSPILLYLNLFSKVIVYIIIVFLFRINFKEILFKKVKARIIFLAILLGILYIFFEGFILNALIKGIPNTSLYQILTDKIELYTMNIPDSRIFILVYTIVVAPVCEELVFRGVMLDNLLKCFKKPYMPVIISSSLFGFFHLSLGAGINAFVFGLLSSFVYIKYKNIRYNIAIHRTINIVTFLVLLFN